MNKHHYLWGSMNTEVEERIILATNPQIRTRLDKYLLGNSMISGGILP